MISYHDFMQSYLEELDPSRKIIEEIEEATDKSKVYKENFIFRDNLQLKKITPVLKTGDGRDKLVDFTAAFIDANAVALAKSGPIMMIRFTDNDCNKLYDMFNTSKDEVMTLFNQVIQDTYYGKLSKPLQGLIERAPHKLVVVAALIDAVQNNYTDIVECMEYLLPLIDYPMLFSHYWPTGVKEEVMEYTVEHLPNKFKLKKVSNLQGLLRWDGKSAIDHFKNKITDGQDHWYADVIYSMRSRLNNTFKNISSMYYKNSESGKTQHKNITQYDDGSIADTNEGMSTIAAQVIDNTISKFASGTINLNIVKRCAEAMQVDRGNLEGFINQIYGDRTSQIPKFIEYTISAYFNKYPTSTRIQASEFVPFGLSLYRSIATSKETMLKNIKDIVNHWMYEIIHIDQLYNREGTKSVYTRAVFNYFILMINYYNLL